MKVRLSAYADVVVLGEVVQELLPHERIVQETRQLVSYVLDGFVCKRPRQTRQSLVGPVVQHCAATYRTQPKQNVVKA